MVALPTFILPPEAARKSGQFTPQMGVETMMERAVIVNICLGQGGPKEKEGKVNRFGDTAEQFGEFLAVGFGVAALPPKPQDSPYAVTLSVLPERVVRRDREVAEEEIAIQQQAANRGESQRETELCSGTVGIREQVYWVGTAAVRSVEVMSVSEPVCNVGRDALEKQLKPQMRSDVEVVN